MRSDDLAPLLADRPGQTLRMHTATVVTWNTTTGENVLTIDGSTFTNLPVAGPVTGVAAANQVLVIADTTRAFVVGKITRP